MDEFEILIGKLDVSLFAKITSQSTNEDKSSMLACQLAVRELRDNYRYLEIGSYLGGSIQPFLFDGRCEKVFSIDKRPNVQPDARGFDWTYENNSTARMMENLLEVSANGVRKVKAIDADASEIKASEIPDKIDLCLIDGEHTDSAVISDFRFCLETLQGNGAIMFHDAQITYNGISECIELLKARSIAFNAYVLPHVLFVVEIGNFPLHLHPSIQQKLINGYSGYLFSLMENDRYRRFANRRPFRMIRNLIGKIRKGNISY